MAVWVVSLSTTDVITRSLSPMIALDGIRSLQWFGNPVWAPSHNSALPPSVIHKALPK